MTKENILRFLRRTVVIQIGLILVGLLVSWIFGGINPYALGTIFTWFGVIILGFVALLGFGGITSKGEDVTAYSLSGAGKMDNHMKQIAAGFHGRIGWIGTGVMNGILQLLIGFILQSLGS